MSSEYVNVRVCTQASVCEIYVLFITKKGVKWNRKCCLNRNWEFIWDTQTRICYKIACNKKRNWQKKGNCKHKFQVFVVKKNVLNSQSSLFPILISCNEHNEYNYIFEIKFNATVIRNY